MFWGSLGIPEETDTLSWPAAYPFAHHPPAMDVDTMSGAAAILRQEKETQHTADGKEKKKLGLCGIIEPLPLSKPTSL